MGVAEEIAQVLQRQQVRVTFFAAQEATQKGDASLGDYWAPWWRARAAEGHAFASHSWSHLLWQADLADGRLRLRASGGDSPGQLRTLDAAAYCADIRRASARLQAVTGVPPLPLFRAPGGKTSPQLLQAVRACGYAQVGWSSAGFLGDELPSARYSNAWLLRQALTHIQSGDILMAHLGIWSRQDPWAPTVLEPLIVGLKARGFCFRTLDAHPNYPFLQEQP